MNGKEEMERKEEEAEEREEEGGRRKGRKSEIIHVLNIYETAFSFITYPCFNIKNVQYY